MLKIGSIIMGNLQRLPDFSELAAAKAQGKEGELFQLGIITEKPKDSGQEEQAATELYNKLRKVGVRVVGVEAWRSTTTVQAYGVEWAFVASILPQTSPK